MRVLSVDVGYGDCKVIDGDETGIKSLYKIPSVAARVEVNELISDDRVITVGEQHFYLGKDALQLQSASIIDINTYEKLEYFAPMFVYRALKDLQVIPDVIVLGLSIVQIANSGHYKTNVEDFLRKCGVASKIFIVPQGASAKLAIDKYGVDFPELTKDFNSNSSYVLADIGFNTLDICHVVNGATSSNLVKGIENMGAILIVNELVIEIHNQYKIVLNSSEGKEVLYTGVLKRRGKSYDVTKIILDIKTKYIDNLKTTIENTFGEVLDKVDALVVVGGGNYILNPGQVGFVRGPKESSEYYNAIGYWIYGMKQQK